MPQCSKILLIELGEAMLQVAHTPLPETLCELFTGFSEASQGKAAICRLLHTLGESSLHQAIHQLTGRRVADAQRLRQFALRLQHVAHAGEAHRQIALPASGQSL